MKEQDIKNLGFNENTTKILIDLNASEDEYLKGIMYSLENSQRPYGVHKELKNFMQQFERKLADNHSEIVTIKDRDGIFMLQIVEVDEKGKFADETMLKISTEKKLAILKMPTRNVKYSYEDGKFVEKISERVM